MAGEGPTSTKRLGELGRTQSTSAGEAPIIQANGTIAYEDVGTEAELTTHAALQGTSAHGATTTATASKIVSRDASGNITGNVLVSDVATGTAPLTVTSPTVVANLNVSALEGNAASAFATAAQGSTADAALPRAGGQMSGNITMVGAQTVDGRDLSADGSKLDGVEALADVTDATNVAAAGAVMDADFTAADDVLVGTGVGTSAPVNLTANTVLGKLAGATVAVPIGVTASTDLIDRSAGDTRYAALADAVPATTQGAIQFGSAAGNLAEDSSNLFWDDTEDRLGVGIGAPTHHIHAVLPADDDFFVDARTTPNTQPDGAFHVHHTAGSTGTKAIGIATDINSFPDTPAIQISHTITGLAAGEDTAVVEVDVATSTASGGIVEAFRVNKSGSGTAAVHAFHAGPGTIPLHQDSAAFGAVDTAFTYDGGYTDVTAAFNATGTDVTMFAANGDIVYIGADAVFGEVDWDLDTPSTGVGVRPIFEYWSGASWSTFGPLDGTNGFRQNGEMSWQPTNLAGWALTVVNGANKYWFRITRNIPAAITAPIENLVRVAAATEYIWNENGDVNIRKLTLGTTTQVDGILDDDTLAADSNTDLVTQQSVKAYIDTTKLTVSEYSARPSYTIYDGTDGTGWTDVGGNGTVAFVGGVIHFTAPTATDLDYQAGATYVAPYTWRSLGAVDPFNFSVFVRIVATTPAEASLQTGIILDTESGDSGYAVYCVARASGHVHSGTVAPAAALIADFDTGGFPVDGTGYVGLIVRGTVARAVWGVGDATTLPSAWTTVINSGTDATGVMDLSAMVLTGARAFRFLKVITRKPGGNTTTACTADMDDVIIFSERAGESLGI